VATKFCTGTLNNFVPSLQNLLYLILLATIIFR